MEQRVAEFFNKLGMEVTPFEEGFKVTSGGREVGVVGAEEKTRRWDDQPYQSQEITLEGWNEEDIPRRDNLRLVIVPGVGCGDDVSFYLVDDPGGGKVDSLVVYAVHDESSPSGAVVRVRVR